MPDAEHTQKRPESVEIEPYRGFTVALTYGTVGVFATVTGRNGVQFVTAVYRHVVLAILHARSLIDRYLRGLELAGLPYPGEEMPGLLRRMIMDGAA